MQARILHGAILVTLAALAPVSVGASIAACSSSSAALPPVTADGGDATTAAASWPSTPCGACVVSGCGPQRQVCDSEPSCAAHSGCADKCTAMPDGTIDAACLAACPGGDNAVASKSRAAYDACITTTGLPACSACPASVGAAPSADDVLAQKCGTSTDPNTCFKCEDERCCNTYAACDAEPECKVQLEGCLKACGADGTAACRSACYAAHPKGVATWAPRTTCLDTRCITECGGPATPDPCFDCGVLSSCRDTHARCASNEGCFLLLACLDTDCPNVTDTCIKSCKAKVDPSAAPLFDAWFSCTAVACDKICN